MHTQYHLKESSILKKVSHLYMESVGKFIQQISMRLTKTKAERQRLADASMIHEIASSCEKLHPALANEIRQIAARDF